MLQLNIKVFNTYCTLVMYGNCFKYFTKCLFNIPSVFLVCQFVMSYQFFVYLPWSTEQPVDMDFETNNNCKTIIENRK